MILRRQSYLTHEEISQDPGGLHYRWFIKAMIPASFALLIVYSFGYTVKNINIYRNSQQAGAGEQVESTGKGARS